MSRKPATELRNNPVRCTHCDGVYDLGFVEVTARYSDCTMWKTPCCKRVVDDREWPRRSYVPYHGTANPFEVPS